MGEEEMKKINILFVCRYNRFRSRIALAYFNKINKNKNIKAKSAGLIRGNSLNPFTVEIAKEFDLNIRGKTQGLSSKLMAWQNVTIIVANDVPPQVFNRNKRYGKKVIVWKIKDVNEKDKPAIKKIIKSIILRIDILNKELEKGK
jgi:protein-tyrosine-phosphatase